jgi:hypothetical protein
LKQYPFVAYSENLGSVLAALFFCLVFVFAFQVTSTGGL